MNNKPSANIICDSVAPNGVRLTTFVVTFHRYILAEVNTHKMISKSSASSRAIPSKVMIQRVLNNPALPVSWGSNQPGMQAGAELSDLGVDTAKQIWQLASEDAVKNARHLQAIGLHKQVANRLLEPFNWHTAILTTTELDNFFWQRCDKDAQPEFKALADAMQLEYYTKQPNPLKNDEWHLPFADDDETHEEVLKALGYDKSYPADMSCWYENITEYKKQLSVARCARVSYLHHDGTRALDKDLDLYGKLITGMHPSPSEHQGTPCSHVGELKYFQDYIDTYSNTDAVQVRCKYQGNFSTGWHQLRKFTTNENRLNFIPNLPGLEKQAEILKAGGKLW